MSVCVGFGCRHPGSSPLSSPRHWGMSRDTAALQSGRFGLSFGFPVSLCAFHQAQQEAWSDFCCTPACSPLPFICYPCFSLLLFLFYNCPILGTVFYPLLLEVVLKRPWHFLFFLYCLKAIKSWKCVLLLRTRTWSVCLKAVLNTMSLICMHGKKRREQITCVTFNLWRVSRITPDPWGICFPQGLCKGHSWEMAVNKWSETEFRLRGFAWDFLWSSATSHTATFLSWGCCPLTVRGKYMIKIWKGQKISDWWVELAHTSNDAFMVRHHKKDASQLEFGSWQANPAIFWVLGRPQIVSLHTKVGIFLKFNSVTKQLSWPDLFAVAWKGQKRKAWVFFPSSYLHATLPTSSGIFNFLGFLSCMEIQAKQGSLPTGHFPQDKVAWRVLSFSHAARASSVWKAAEDGQYLQPGGSCVTICGCLFLIYPSRSHLGPFWWLSSRAARFGADFLFQHSWLFPPSKQGVGLLAALSASTACIPAMSTALLFSRLLLSAADTLTPSQKCQCWELLVPGICSWALLPHVSLCVSFCCSSPGYFPAELVRVIFQRQKTRSACYIFCMAWP